jgi:hypothetical protein
MKQKTVFVFAGGSSLWAEGCYFLTYSRISINAYFICQIQ